MKRRVAFFSLGLLTGGLSACAAGPAAPAASAGASSPPEGDGPGPASASQGETSTAPGVESARVDRSWVDERPGDPKRALPAVSVRSVGMHIGGGSNSAEEKRPFLAALATVETKLLVCYRWVDKPLTGGTFGVDLLVPLAGGAPVIQGTRQKLGGLEFVGCMEKALGEARFSQPLRATVLSYSLRFDVHDVTR